MQSEEPPECILEELVERFRQGDAQAGKQLLKDPRLHRKVEGLARKKTIDSLVSWEDAAQEARIKIIVGVRNQKFCWRGVGQFYQWAEKVIESAINDLFRKEKRLRGGELKDLSLDAPYSGDEEEGITQTIGDRQEDEKLSEAVKLAEEVGEVRAAVEKIDRRFPKKEFLTLWKGLLQEKDQSQQAADLAVKQPEIAKRLKELSIRVAAELGRLSSEQVKQELQAIRQGKGKALSRSDTQW